MRHKKLKQRLIDFQHMSWVEQNPQNSERNGNERAKKKKKKSENRTPTKVPNTSEIDKQNKLQNYRSDREKPNKNLYST